MRAIPPVIKAEIFRKYLVEGLSTTEISKLYNVSVGSISSIITEESNKDNDFFSIREITKIFKKYNLHISDIIDGIRLYNKIKQVELDIFFFESFIESTNTESFRLEKDHSKFLEDIKRIVKFEEIYKIKIEDIPVYIIDSIKKHKELIDENKKIKEENAKLYSKYNVDKSEIEEYLKDKTLFLQYKKDKWRYRKYTEWFINPGIYDEASRIIGITIDPHALYKKLNWLYLFPHKHKALIKKIMAIDNDIFNSEL